MLRARARIGVLSTIILLASAAGATPYWIAWEGNEYPENEGWMRGYSAGGAVRTLGGGMMTLDGTQSTAIFDSYLLERPGAFDPGPNEYLAVEWRVKVEATPGYPYDIAVAFRSDAAWAADVFLSRDRLQILPGFVVVPYEPDVFHEFRLISHDLRTFELHLDGALAYSGPLSRLVTRSEMIWGDAAIGASSRSTWDYFRFGAVEIPEPSMVVAFLAAGAVTRRRYCC